MTIYAYIVGSHTVDVSYNACEAWSCANIYQRLVEVCFTVTVCVVRCVFNTLEQYTPGRNFPSSN